MVCDCVKIRCFWCGGFRCEHEMCMCSGYKKKLGGA
jgi:hypothetical protein